MPKTLQPGNVKCKINAVSLEVFELKKEEGALQFILSLESEPIPGFEGFLKDKDDPEGPKYEGQVGNVKASEWAYMDGEQFHRDWNRLQFTIQVPVFQPGQRLQPWVHYNLWNNIADKLEDKQAQYNQGHTRNRGAGEGKEELDPIDSWRSNGTCRVCSILSVAR